MTSPTAAVPTGLLVRRLITSPERHLLGAAVGGLDFKGDWRPLLATWLMMQSFIRAQANGDDQPTSAATLLADLSAGRWSVMPVVS